MSFKVLYALANKSKEALITETISMKDSRDTPQTFSKSVQVRASPKESNLGYFDDEPCRLEPIDNPVRPKVLPMSPE